LNFCKQIHNAKYYSSVEEIPSNIWRELGCENNLYLNPKYLSAIAKNHTNIEFYYVVLHNEQYNPIAFSTIQIVNFNINGVQKKDLFSVDKVKIVFEKLGIVSTKKPIKILTSGNTFVSGEHGIFIKQNENKQNVIKDLAKSVVHFVNSKTELKKEVKAYMLKDFVKESLVITDELHEANYYSFNVDPNMIMHIDSDWSYGT